MVKEDLKDFLNNNWLILAPMAGVNDVVFRELCIKNGAMLTYTEMVSSKALEYNNSKTKNLLELAKGEDQVVVQLFGHEPDTIAQQAKIVSEQLGDKLAFIDINMGCPAPKITKKGDGAALMKNPNLASQIVSECVKQCDVPITVKFRRGYKQNDDTSLNFAIKMQDSGASAVCIHGRYAQQFYKGNADIECVVKIKEKLKIPVLWSGDVKSFEDAKIIKEKYNFDGILIGRAARGNPWVFNEKPNIDAKYRIKLALYHLENYYRLYPKNLSYMRKHCMWYISGMPGATIARNKISTCVTIDEYIDVFNQLLERLEK